MKKENNNKNEHRGSTGDLMIKYQLEMKVVDNAPTSFYSTKGEIINADDKNKM